MSERVKTRLQEPWKVEASPFEVYNVDHGPLTHHIVSGNTMIAALYVDHDSVEANHLRAAPALVEALEDMLADYRDACEEWDAENQEQGLEIIEKAEAALSLAYGETQ